MVQPIPIQKESYTGRLSFQLVNGLFRRYLQLHVEIRTEIRQPYSDIVERIYDSWRPATENDMLFFGSRATFILEGPK